MGYRGTYDWLKKENKARGGGESMEKDRIKENLRWGKSSIVVHLTQSSLSTATQVQLKF